MKLWLEWGRQGFHTILQSVHLGDRESNGRMDVTEVIELPIMSSRVMHLQKKIRLTKTVIRPVLGYASESWTPESQNQFLMH
jgi:hypothetical protein